MQSYKFMFSCHLKKFAAFPIFVCSSHFDCEHFTLLGRKWAHILVTTEVTYRCIVGGQKMFAGGDLCGQLNFYKR